MFCFLLGTAYVFVTFSISMWSSLTNTWCTQLQSSFSNDKQISSSGTYKRRGRKYTNMNVFYLNFIFLLRCFSNAQYHLAKEENVEKTRIIGEFANITFTYCLMKCKDTTKCRFVGTDTHLSSQPLIHCYLIKERALGSTTGTENTKRMNILEEVNKI